MWRSKSQTDSDSQDAGAPEWMVTFSDCMTLLLTFFVLLLSFSSFDERTFRRLKWIFGDALPSVRPHSKMEQIRDKDAFLPQDQIVSTEEFDDASEKPTQSRGEEDGLMEETEPVDFRKRKIFLISSKKVFWGDGTAVSSRGYSTLSAMASFLKEIPCLVVISENGPGGDEGKAFGLPRAWTVMEYLTTEQKLDKSRFSISAVSIAGQTTSMGGQPDRPERMLEIVLLERRI